MKKLKFPKISEKMKRRFLVGACAVMMIFISVMAYFTSTEQTSNAFTVGNVKIDLVEPNFPGSANPDRVGSNNRTNGSGRDISYADANYVLPGELVPKDPTIVNTGKNEAIVFMKVEVPLYTDKNQKDHEVFAISLGDVTNPHAYNSGTSDPKDVTITKFTEIDDNTILPNGWIYLGRADGTDSSGMTADVNDTTQNNAHTYIFGYSTILNPEVSADHIQDNAVYHDSSHNSSVENYQTSPLFKYIVLNPEINGVDTYEGNKFYQLTIDDDTQQITNAKAVKQNIKVYAYGVQSKFLREQNNTQAIPTDNLNKDNLTKIWEAAGFGAIINDTIPNADNHNKYGIPEDPNNANSSNNPYTDAEQQYRSTYKANDVNIDNFDSNQYLTVQSLANAISVNSWFDLSGDPPTETGASGTLNLKYQLTGVLDNSEITLYVEKLETGAKVYMHSSDDKYHQCGTLTVIEEYV